MFPDFISYRVICNLSNAVGLGETMCITPPDFTFITPIFGELFIQHIKVSFLLGIIASFPYIFWEIWRFIKPAMKASEQKYSSGGVFISSVLFLMGILFSYFIIVPLTVNFLGTYQVSESVYNQISLTSYISTVVSVTFSVGLVSELPILVYFLTKIGVLTPDFMRTNRKYMYVVMLILSAIVTPSRYV